MSLKINYSNKTLSKNSSNIVLFTNEDFKINRLKNFLLDSEFSYIDELLKFFRERKLNKKITKTRTTA